jgi:hypothetical protein
MTACYSAAVDTWYPRVRSVKVSYQTYFCNTYQTLIYGPNDAVIDANTYCIVVEDFVPYTGNPDYANFYAYNCESAGLQAGATEFSSQFANAWQDYEPQIEALPVGFYCNGGSTVDDVLQALQAQINFKLRAAEDQAFAQMGYDPNNPEPTANMVNVRNGCLLDLVNEICNLWNDPPTRSCSSCAGQGN